MPCDVDGRRWSCEKCGQSGIAFAGCGMSECEAKREPRDPQPARFDTGPE